MAGCSPEYGPYKTLYSRFIRWSHIGIFNNFFLELSKTAGNDGKVMIDVTHLKAHGTAANLLKKWLIPAPSDAQEVDCTPSFMHFVTEKADLLLFTHRGSGKRL